MNFFNSRSKSTFFITRVAVLAAIATILMLFEMPLPIFPSFYKIDISSVPVIIGTFTMGPIAGLCIQLIKDLLNLLTNSASLGVGQLADFLVCGSYIVTAGLIYGKIKTKKTSIIAMIAGTILASIVGCFLNYYVLIPFFAYLFKTPISAFIALGSAINPAVKDLKTLVIFCTLPFNILKFSLISIITFFVYKRLSKFLSLRKK